MPTAKFIATQVFTAVLASWILLQMASAFSGVDAQLILVSGIALSTFGTAILTVYGQYTLNKVKRTGEATHMLSNSAMGVQLQTKLDMAKELAVMCRRLADYTKQPEAEAASLAAEVKVALARTELQEHLIRQAKVDAVGAK
jgi:hypothetical protein